MEDWLQPSLRFVHYALLLGLFGWAAFRVIGLRGADWLPADTGRTVAIVAVVIALVVSTVLMLASIAAMVGQSMADLDGQMIAAMTLSTDMGWAFLARIALLLGAAIALSAGRTATGLSVAAVFLAGALMTLGWSGHAAATEGTLGLLHRLGNGVHMFAAGLWLGAIGWLARLVWMAHRSPVRVRPQPLLAAMHGFAPLGVTLVAIVSATGLLNAHLIFGLENSATVVTTGYGLLLAAKVALVGGMLACAAHNASISRRNWSIDAETPRDDTTALSALRRSLAIELALGVAVIALVAILGMLSPMVME